MTPSSPYLSHAHPPASTPQAGWRSQCQRAAASRTASRTSGSSSTQLSSVHCLLPVYKPESSAFVIVRVVVVVVVVVVCPATSCESIAIRKYRHTRGQFVKIHPLAPRLLRGIEPATGVRKTNASAPLLPAVVVSAPVSQAACQKIKVGTVGAAPVSPGSWGRWCHCLHPIQSLPGRHTAAASTHSAPRPAPTAPGINLTSALILSTPFSVITLLT